MTNKIIKIKPFFSKRIWGGNKLKEYGFNIPSNDIGEAWLISAHENGMSLLEDNTTFKDFFEKNRDKFGISNGLDFPLLSKIITANDYLSVQVHPNDQYAKVHHNSLGKPESWYVIDCPKDAKLIYGHKANNLDSFKQLMQEGNWKDLLKEVEVKKGDFLYVEPGKIHAITPGVVVYELQRSSDITYRLYDYDRVDDKGNPRELHIKESLDNLSIPDSKDIILRKQDNLKFNCEFFSFEKNKIEFGKAFIWKKPENIKWYQLTILNGNCTINNINFKMGESAICIDNLKELEIIGKCEIIISWT
ncbi:type I phosphomannose isomerase catalytic subunit [Spiroplasma cantharicola]|uniref:Mannose-6-phosphate isomerase n=1 Tax=Spiroplasma cantharicola TaxID=362837 RepID=A0A0M4JWX0_9MOLU|nr:type I phosphomannose isomerase catalytic subunit [Spiroplasma cantharicola]ALD66517.1 mannose-6-phosphate isomerase [Spiroplasma cantharicola]